MRTNPVTVLAVLLLVAAALPGAATAAAAVDVTVEQDDATGEALVVVTENGTAVENATVNVTGDGAYAGAGTYETDANGTVTLPQPEETQNVSVVATDGDATASTTVRLVGDVDFSVAVTQAEDGAVTVDVERNGTAVANATVGVTVENGSYAAVGNYTTDENGTVELAAPAENVTATVTASEAGDAATETVTLIARETPLDVTVSQSAGVEIGVSRGDEAVENATVTVTSAGTYVGAGTYETDANGTVSLPMPTENVSVTVTATADGDVASETVRLTTAFVGQQKNFGQSVLMFLDALRTGQFDGPAGRIISEFVTANNPGNADDAPGHSDARDGPKNGAAADAGPRADKGTRGPPEHAKENGAKENGRNAGEDASDAADGDSSDGDSADDSERGNGNSDGGDAEDSSDDSDDGERGRPDHANGKSKK